MVWCPAMELKVWVEGIQRIVCGVTESTTCQDVVFALAHATGKSGRFTLIERWRCNERLLAPQEHPLKILSKWGEYSNDVQFILQWNESSNKRSTQTGLNRQKTLTTSPPLSNSPSHSGSALSVESPEKSRPLGSGVNHINADKVGIVKGIPQVKSPIRDICDNNNESPKKNSSHKNDSALPYNVRREVPPYKEPPTLPAPPPYRNPPPPLTTLPGNNLKQKKNPLKEVNRQSGLNTSEENVLYNAQYKELVQLINYQKEKLSSQQADLTKYDAEIVFWETKSRENQHRMDFIAQELVKISNISRINNDKINALNYIEEEHEIVRQQEKTLKSEITLLRSKLANCETELLQCKNKIRLLMEDLQMEKRTQVRLGESQLQLERSLLTEVERLQNELEIANQNTERNHQTADTLKQEVASLEAAIIEKKREVETLVQEMKEANLRSLSIASAEEVKQLLEGQNKAGSTRKMIGSPRQLENAVPTNKNPHGVWV